MNLLEALIALVILGLSAGSFLDVFQSGARSAVRAGEWDRLVSAAEATMEAATLGDALQADQAAPQPADSITRRVDVRPWKEGVVDVAVTVTSPGGTVFTLHRLTRLRRGGGPS